MFQKAEHEPSDLIDSLLALEERKNAFNFKKIATRREELRANQILDDELTAVLQEANQEDQSRSDALRRNISDNDEQLKLAQQKSNRQDIVFDAINNRPDADIFLSNPNLREVRNCFVNYIENGDVFTIFNAIRQSPQDLKYTHSPQICRMALRIIDSYYASILVTELMSDEQSRPRFDQTRNVHAKISAFSEYGQLNNNHTVNELSKALEEDLNHFISDQYSSDTFKTLFLARLHSQDDQLCQRTDREKLFVLIANIAICVLTIGVATVAQLIYSKKTTGEYRFFFAKTDAEDKAFNIENELTTPLLT
jgi:hypothetical protein